ncbi:hypothetical protein AB2B38_010230 [Balneola sp. MJW-20]|uniref:hypothetical protein n=1 Tax=Gracilimonas aurantiaca TaxID=3234185 RepID=UPI00346720FD
MKHGLRITSLFLLMMPFCVQAQTGGNQNSLLPEINPQDIEIRSEFRARFPGLRRQPILGFNPKPRVFRIDPNRIPFMESRDEAVASIAVTQLNRPAPPSRSYLPTPDLNDIYGRLGFGSFITPEAELYARTELSDNSLLSGGFNLITTDGHLSDQESSFRYFDAEATYQYRSDNDLIFEAGIGALADKNDLYNLDPFFQNAMQTTADKEYLGLNVETSVRKVKNAVEGWEGTLAANLFKTNLEAYASGLSGDISEQVIRTGFDRYWAGNNIRETFRVSLFAVGGNYDISSAGSESWIHAGGGLQYQRQLTASTHVDAKAGLEYISDAFSDKIYISPELKLKQEIRSGIVIEANAYARPEMPEVMELQQYNRFLNTNTQLQHRYEAGLNGEIGVQLFKGNRVFGGAGYEFIRDYAFFSRTTQTVAAAEVPLFYNVNYGNANILMIYGGISQHVIPNKFWFSSKVYARRPELKSGGRIPFEERLGLDGSMSFKVTNSFTLNSSAEYIGRRRTAVTDEELSAYLLVNGGAEYDINNRFAIYVRVLNLLGQNYEVWQGYRERPFQLFGGLTIKL